MKEYIEREAARRIIDSPRSQMQMLNMLKSVPKADVISTPDRKLIDDYLLHIYRNQGTSASQGAVVAMKYYIAKLYEEIYGEGERPIWLNT